MDLKKEFEKHDDLFNAVRNLKNQSFGRHMNLYYAICLDMCSRFTNEEIKEIIEKQVTRLNEGQ